MGLKSSNEKMKKNKLYKKIKKMYFEHVSWQHLLPIQISISGYKLERVLSVSRNRLDTLPPIALVPLEEKFIICDGHHRGIRFVMEQLPIPAEIMETDDDIANSKQGALSYLENRRDVINAYLSEWKPLCIMSGIVTLDDLRKKYESEIQKHEREQKEVKRWYSHHQRFTTNPQAKPIFTGVIKWK